MTLTATKMGRCALAAALGGALLAAATPGLARDQLAEFGVRIAIQKAVESRLLGHFQFIEKDCIIAKLACLGLGFDDVEKRSAIVCISRFSDFSKVVQQLNIFAGHQLCFAYVHKLIKRFTDGYGDVPHRFVQIELGNPRFHLYYLPGLRQLARKRNHL